MITIDEFKTLLPTLKENFSASGKTCAALQNSYCAECKFRIPYVTPNDDTRCFIHHTNKDYMLFITTNFPELLL